MKMDPGSVPQSNAGPRWAAGRGDDSGRRRVLRSSGRWLAVLAVGFLLGAIGRSGAAAPASESRLGTLVVNVVGVGEHSGTVVVLLFDHDDGFPAKIAKACHRASAKVTGSVVTLRFADVPLGTYAVTAYHDVNDNQKLDTNWIGIPKEPVAISNNARGRLGPPKWKDATFELREATQELTVSLMRI